MSDAAEFAALRRVTPAEAVAYLQAKGIMATTTNWQDFWHEEHATAFTISRLTRLDILQSLHDGLVQSVQGDLSRRDWLKNAKTLLQQTGWWGKNAVTDTATGEQVFTTFNPSRLQLIYDINTGQAAAAGQWARLQAAKRTHPYARYITKRDERVREAHRRWDNLVLPVDHPFWQAHWPPNGWRCRCRAIGVSQREYDSGTTPTGAPMKKEAPEEVLRRYTNPRTGEITDLPVGIDPGFAYNAGVARQQALAGLIKDKLAAADAYLAKQAKAAGFTAPKPAGAKEITDQPTWQDLGLRDLREMTPKMQAPELLGQGRSLDEAIAILRQALMVPANGSRAVDTPVGKVTLLDELLWHVVEKRPDARERFANFVLPALQTPDEVWLTKYSDDTTRKRYIKLFTGTRTGIYIVVQEQPNGDVLWNMIPQSAASINKRRVGDLLFRTVDSEKAS